MRLESLPDVLDGLHVTPGEAPCGLPGGRRCCPTRPHIRPGCFSLFLRTRHLRWTAWTGGRSARSLGRVWQNVARLCGSCRVVVLPSSARTLGRWCGEFAAARHTECSIRNGQGVVLIYSARGRSRTRLPSTGGDCRDCRSSRHGNMNRTCDDIDGKHARARGRTWLVDSSTTGDAAV